MAAVKTPPKAQKEKGLASSPDVESPSSAASPVSTRSTVNEAPSSQPAAPAASTPPGTAVVECCNLSKTFRSGTRSHKALKDVSVTVQQGEMVALIGASGSGKSTLLRHLSGLVEADRKTGCNIVVNGSQVQHENGLARGIRKVRCNIGFIFQQFNLVGRLTLLKNVCLGMIGRVPMYRSFFGIFTLEERRLAMAALERVGMADYAGQRASTLSGGQQQRGAIARAMVQGARVLLADEPIASLDPASSTKVMQSLQDLHQDGVTIMVCLHQVEYARRYCPRTIALRDGVIVFDGPTEVLTDDTLRELYGSEADDACFTDAGAALAAAQARSDQSPPAAALG